MFSNLRLFFWRFIKNKIWNIPQTQQPMTIEQLTKTKAIERRNMAAVVRATSHLTMRLTAMRMTVHEVSSHLCKILTLIIVKTYLQKGRRHYRIARRPVVTCYNSAKPPKTSKSVRKRPKTHLFSARRASINGRHN